MEEDSIELRPEEIAALFGLTRTPEEKHVILKLLLLLWADA
jgi:hypothetical protein